MKKLITIIILPFAVYCKDVTLAVLPFDAAGISKNEAIILTDRLSTEFFKLEAFIVIERSKMDDVLNEQGFFNKPDVRLLNVLWKLVIY